MSGKSLGFNSSVSLLEDEILPEITLLDVTCESPLPGSKPATPGSVNIRFTPRHTSAHINTSAWKACPQRNALDLLQSNVSAHKSESEICDVKSSLQNDTKREMNMNDKENYSEVHSPEHSGTATSTDSKVKMFVPSKCMYSPENWLDVRYIPEITLLDVTHDSELSPGGESSSMDKNDSFLEKSKPSGPDMKTESAEDTVATRPVNLTHDISSSSDLSVQSVVSQVSAFDMQCNTSSKSGTSELHGDTVEADNDDPPTNHDAKSTSKEPQSTPNTSGSGNATFTSLQPSQLSSSTDSNTTAQITCPQNTTLDLPSHASTPKEESEATDVAVSKNTTETPLVVNENSSVKANDSCDMPNATFDRHSLQKSSAGTVLYDAGSVTPCTQNNTFDAKPPSKPDGTINLSETSDSPQTTFDRLSPLKACNATSSPKENNSENLELLKNNGTPASADADVNDASESTFEADRAVGVASSAAGRRDTKDHSQSCLPLTDGLSDSLAHQNTDLDNNKAIAFNLDDTLDLRADSLITSTPVTNCKMLNLNAQREHGKITLAQKQLYGDVLCKPGSQLPSDVPSNIVSDRKTFLTHAAHKFIVPPSKPASQLLKHKPASALPGRLEALASGLPVTRQRTRGEALRNAAPPDAPQTTGISSSYKLRSSTAVSTLGSKQSSSGLQRPQQSGIPSGIQRAATGLRLPSVKSSTPATSKLCGPTATNPVVKTAQGKKHPLTRGEALPLAKRKKMDPPSLGGAEASRTSCDATNGAKSLKQPTTNKRALPAKTQRDDAALPASSEVSASCDAVSRARSLKQPAARAVMAKPKGNGCINCVMFEQQLKLKTEEIQRLKEELLRKSKQEEEC